MGADGSDGLHRAWANGLNFFELEFYDVQLLILLLVTVWLNNPQFRIFIAIALLWY